MKKFQFYLFDSEINKYYSWKECEGLIKNSKIITIHSDSLENAEKEMEQRYLNNLTKCWSEVNETNNIIKSNKV